jgi:hypothetical protein
MPRKLLVIPSARRPALATRAVRSYFAHASRSGADLDIVVVSDDEQTDGDYSLHLASVDVGAAGRLFHLSQPERSSLADLMALSTGSAADVWYDALCGKPDGLGREDAYGAARNVGLLIASSFGVSEVFFADDDTLCEPHGDEVASTSGNFACYGHDGSEVRLSSEPWEDASPCLRFNFFDSQVWALRQEPVVARPEETSACHHYAATGLGPSGISLSSFGSRGDSGFRSNAPWLLSANATTRTHLLNRENDCIEAMRSGYVYRRVERPTFSHCIDTMSMACCIDTTRFLLPFMARGRGEDLVRSAALQRFWPRTFVAHLPVTILHAPPTPRVRERAIYSIGISDLMIALTHSDLASGLSGQAGASEFGRRLTTVAADGPAAVIRLIRASLVLIVSQRVERLMASLRSDLGRSAYWTSEIRLTITRFGDQLRSISDDFERCLTRDLGDLQDVCATLSRFGTLMHCWSEAMHTSQQSTHPRPISVTI